MRDGKIRLHVSGAPAELVGDLCPECGSLLEPAAGVAELIGYRTVEPQDHQADPIRSGSHQQIADHVDEFVARRAARLDANATSSKPRAGSINPTATSPRSPCRCPARTPPSLRKVHIDDNAILAVVDAPGSPSRSGGHAIERAAIMASGADFAAIEAWILAHAGTPERRPAHRNPQRGLHGHRLAGTAGADGAPHRFRASTWRSTTA